MVTDTSKENTIDGKTKYTIIESNKFAFDQIDLAIERGFYLEVITIEGSNFAFRLISFLQLKGGKINNRYNFCNCLRFYYLLCCTYELNPGIKKILSV